MPLRQLARPSLCLIAISLFLALVPGCLETDKTVEAKYDKEKDEFSYLVVYQRIRGGTGKNDRYDVATDLARLKRLYANRDHLLVFPLGSPWPMEDWGESAALLAGKESAADVDLSSATGPAAKKLDAAIPLDQIQIKPGKFFLRDDDNLCYYHQVIVPGKVLDAAIAYLNKQGPFTGLPDTIKAELERRKSGGAVVTWDEMARVHAPKMAKLLLQVGTKDCGGDPVPVYQACDQTTLEYLLKAAEQKQVPIDRRERAVYARFAVSKADAQGFTAFIEAVRKELKQELKSLPATRPGNQRLLDGVAKLADAIGVRVDEQGRLELSIDIIAFINGFAGPADPLRQRDPEKLARAAEMAKLAQDALPIEKPLTVEQVVADFRAGKLASNPSLQPADPTKGLGETDPKP